MKKLLVIVVLSILVMGYPAWARSDDGLNPAYEARAQLAIKLMTEQNGLKAHRWPFAKPENWPEENVVWSDESPRRLISLTLFEDDNPVYGTVDISGLTGLEELSILFAEPDEAAPHGLTAGPGSALKSLKIDGGGGQIKSALNFENFTALERLSLSQHGLEKLDLSRNPKLRELDLAFNFNLKQIDLSANAALEALSIYAGFMSNLNLSGNPALKAVSLESCSLKSIELGDNTLPNMEGFAIDSCELPLSALAGLAAVGGDRLFVGNQRYVLFHSLVFPTVEEAVVDLSSEALINGVATDFLILDDKLNIAHPSGYSLENGLIKFKKRGRYTVAMCNQAVCGEKYCDFFKQITKFDQGHLPGLFTGHIDVGDVTDQKKITPSTC